MEHCLVCLEDDFHQIPYLRCGHVVCSECYCKLKALRPVKTSNNCPCPLCKKNMVRSTRKVKQFYNNSF